jgi:hypothetical protein
VPAPTWAGVAVSTLDQLTADLLRFWAQHGQTVIVGVGLALAVFVLVLVTIFIKSGRKSQWAEAVAISAVLGWTSEGMWKVAVDVLHFPVQLALVTFFVAEALLLAAALRAKEQRALTGLPGTYGRIAWFLAVAFGTVVAFNAESLVEVCLRILLPVAVIWLWWAGLMMPHADDSEEMKNARRKQAEEREATWAITPRSVLVRWGILKPGRSTTTEAQKEFQVRRMVEVADKAATAKPADRDRLLRKLRKLTRTADETMVAEVAARVARAVHAERLMLPGVASLATIAVTPPAAVGANAAPVQGGAELADVVVLETAPLEQPASARAQIEEHTPAPVEQAEEQIGAPWATFVRDHEPELANGGMVEHPTQAVSFLTAPARSARSTHGADSTTVVRAVATVPTVPSGRTLFYAAVTQQLRDGDLRILTGDPRVRNAAGYDAASTLDGDLAKVTVRKYVTSFRELLGLALDAHGGQEQLAVALERFPAPVEQPGEHS